MKRKPVCENFYFYNLTPIDNQSLSFINNIKMRLSQHVYKCEYSKLQIISRPHGLLNNFTASLDDQLRDLLGGQLPSLLSIDCVHSKISAGAR